MKLPLGFLKKLVPSGLTENVAKAVYDSWLQSPTGKKLQRWIPLGGTVLYLIVTGMRIAGIAGSDAALHWLHVLNISPGISEAEMTVALTSAAGVAGKVSSMYLKAKGEIVPPNQGPVLQTYEQHKEFNQRVDTLMTAGVPFDDARRLALADVIAKHAPVSVEAKADMKSESRGNVIDAIVDANKDAAVKDKGDDRG